MNATQQAIESTVARDVSVSAALVSCVAYLQSQDANKRSFEYWLDSCILKGYEYNKRLAEEQRKREAHKVADANRAKFHDFIARNPDVLGDKAKLIAVAKSYGQLDDILVKALTAADAKPQAQAATASK